MADGDAIASKEGQEPNRALAGEDDPGRAVEAGHLAEPDVLGSPTEIPGEIRVDEEELAGLWRRALREFKRDSNTGQGTKRRSISS